MFMFILCITFTTSLVTTGHIHVQFTLKVVIIANLINAYIIAVASMEECGEEEVICLLNYKILEYNHPLLFFPGFGTAS